MHERSLTVFVTQLNGIGRQHVRTFQEAGIECRGLWGSTTEMERLNHNAAVASRTLVILVASPEAIVNNPTLISKIEAERLGLVAFDEAHLFESWSRWRPDVTLAASSLDCGRHLALSATVPIGKTSIIQAALKFDEPLVVHRGPFLRRNLVIRVIRRDSAYGGGGSSRIDKCRADLEHAQRVGYAFQMATTCREVGGNMIIFTPSRSEAARVGSELKSLSESLARLDRCQVEPLQGVIYHAGLDNRAATEQLLASTTGIVVVATIVFGMGVHFADVRAVLHFVRVAHVLLLTLTCFHPCVIASRTTGPDRQCVDADHRQFDGVRFLDPFVCFVLTNLFTCNHCVPEFGTLLSTAACFLLF